MASNSDGSGSNGKLKAKLYNYSNVLTILQGLCPEISL
jgi:hypothetical protein